MERDTAAKSFYGPKTVIEQIYCDTLFIWYLLLFSHLDKVDILLWLVRVEVSIKILRVYVFYSIRGIFDQLSLCYKGSSMPFS